MTSLICRWCTTSNSAGEISATIFGEVVRKGRERRERRGRRCFTIQYEIATIMTVTACRQANINTQVVKYKATKISVTHRFNLDK